MTKDMIEESVARALGARRGLEWEINRTVLMDWARAAIAAHTAALSASAPKGMADLIGATIRDTGACGLQIKERRAFCDDPEAEDMPQHACDCWLTGQAVLAAISAEGYVIVKREEVAPVQRETETRVWPDRHRGEGVL